MGSIQPKPLVVATMLFAMVAGCGPPRPPPQPVVNLRRSDLLDIVARERSVAVVRDPPAPLGVSSPSVGQDMMGAGSAIASGGAAGGILGLGLFVAAIPIAIAEGAAEEHREKGMEPFIVDPISVVEQRLVSALHAEPGLGDVEWKSEPSDCGEGSCRPALQLRLRTTARHVCSRSPGWIAYGATATVVRAQGAEILWQGSCLRVNSPSSIELPGVSSKDEQQAFAKEMQSKFDVLAGECGEQLVTSLLGRGAAVSDAPPPPCR
jgi:hypothetical protein